MKDTNLSRILRCLPSRGETLRAHDLAGRLNMTRDMVHRTLQIGLKRGLIVRVRPGDYALADKETT